jgi:enoyl-CoA hydratase/carnithine racemase
VSEILLEKRTPSIAIVTIDRPARRNACDLAAWRDLARTFIMLSEDREVRLVILTGAAGHFCAGADISEFSTARADSASGARYEEEIEACYAAIESLRQPSVAAIEGYCVGGGCALAMCCDFRIARKGARFGIPAAKLSVIYGIHECRLLLSLVGLSNAKRILFKGELVDAAEAARMGLVNEEVAGDPIEAAIDFAGGMIDKAPLSIAGAKLILGSLARGDIERKAPEIDELMRVALESRDYREGQKAFAEKRRPKFVGA